MQGRIAKHIYEIGALSLGGPRNEKFPKEDAEKNVKQHSAFKIAQDYLDSQVNARPDYQRVETATQQAVGVANSDVMELPQAEDNGQNSHDFQFQLGSDKLQEILYSFKNNFGEIGASSSGEPQFHDGSIKITRKQGQSHLIDIVRVIPKDQSQAKKYHDVQYVAIKDKDGNNLQREMEGDLVSRFCFKKVTLSERGPEFDDKVYYYDDEGNIQNCEVSGIKDDDQNTFKQDLARMQIRASVVVNNCNVISTLSTAVLVDNSAGVGRASVKFAMNEINTDDYKDLSEAVLKPDLSSLSANGDPSPRTKSTIFNKESRKFSFTYQSNDSANPDNGKTFGTYSDLVFYHSGHLSDSVLEQVKPNMERNLEAIRRGDERTGSPRGAAYGSRGGALSAESSRRALY